MKTIISVLVAGLVIVVVGCAKDADQGPTPEQIAQEKVQQAIAAGADSDAPPGPAVEVAAEGTRFDPPVQINQLPAGVWFCDMGTVHYARQDQGEGTCAECGMTLTQKGGAVAGVEP